MGGGAVRVAPTMHMLHQMSTQIITSCVDGVFTRLGSDHWALLVHGIFNASIERPPDRPEPAVADRMAFIVTSLNVTDGLLGIVGELAE